MYNQIGPTFLGVLSLLFGGYGVRELASAYYTGPFDEWIGKVGLGTSSFLLCVLFASCTRHLIREIVAAVHRVELRHLIPEVSVDKPVSIRSHRQTDHLHAPQTRPNLRLSAGLD